MDLTRVDDAYFHLKEVTARLIESLSLGRREFLVCQRLLLQGSGIEQVLIELKQDVNLANDMIRELEPFANPESISRAQATLKVYCKGNTDLLRFLPEDKENLSSSLAVLGLLLSYSKDSSSSVANAKGYVRAISKACSEGFVPEEKWRNAEAVARGSSIMEVAQKERSTREKIHYRLSGLFPLVTIRKLREAWRIVEITQDEDDREGAQTDAATSGDAGSNETGEVSAEADETLEGKGNSGLKGGDSDNADRKGEEPPRATIEIPSYAQGRGSVARDPIAMSQAARRVKDDSGARAAKRDELWDLALQTGNSEGGVVSETDRQDVSDRRHVPNGEEPSETDRQRVSRGEEPSTASPDVRDQGAPADPSPTAQQGTSPDSSPTAQQGKLSDSPPAQDRRAFPSSAPVWQKEKKVTRRSGVKTYSEEDCWAAVVEYMSADGRIHSGGDYTRYTRDIEGMPALITIKGRLGLHWVELADTANRLLAGRIRPDEEEWARDVLTPRKWENFVRKSRGSGVSKRFAIELVKQCIADRGPYITHIIYTEWAKELGNMPSHALVNVSGMSWNNLVKAAGGYSGHRNGGMWTKEEILKLVALYIKQEESRGEEPSIEGYSSWARNQTAPLPNIVLVTKRVGSWVEAVKRASTYLRTDDQTLLE